MADEGLPEGQRFADLPGNPEVWKDRKTNKIYMVYFVPDADPEIPMLWEVDDQDMMDEFRDGKPWSEFVDRVFPDISAVDQAGGLQFGSFSEIDLTGPDPFSGWAEQFEREKEVLPWLEDPEGAALWVSSYMENRVPSDAELAGTDWFMEKTSGEQQWISLLWSQPETAKQLQNSNRLAVSQLLEQSGVMGASADIINFIADQWTKGLWTDVQRNQQIALLADPEKQGDLDSGLAAIVNGDPDGFSTTIDQERYVTTEVRKWLGPEFGNWTEDQVQHWAGRIRNDPNAADEFLNELSRQRQAVFPQYENPELTYEDIATPWRNLAFNTWGQNIDETSDVFTKMLQENDAGVAGQLLREEGLNQGVKKVEDSFLEDINRSFSGSGGVRGYAGQ